VIAQALPVTTIAGVDTSPAYVPFPELVPDITNRWANAALFDFTLTVNGPGMLIAIGSSRQAGGTQPNPREARRLLFSASAEIP